MILENIFVIVFIVLSIIGFLIIYKQVILIKKGELTLKDQILCILYGIFFAMGACVVVGMAIIFTIETPEFWETSPTPPPDFNPVFFLIPFFSCLIYISIYPLIDLLFIAINREIEKGFTPIHNFLEDKIINRSEDLRIRILVSILFYFVAFIFPPIIISMMGVPFIIIFISWMLIYPLLFLTFFGAKGYIAGISDVYYHIPDIRRSIFLNFENSRRGFKEFLSNPTPFILFGLMIFVYIWAYISMIQTIVFFFTGSLAISTMSSYFVFITLFMGITGYFTRYFGRHIQSKGYHLLFAAYLMTAIGINVLVNFLIVNPEKLNLVFSLTILTSEINTNYIYFAWAAVIEEMILIIITTYYFLALNNEFIQNLRYSKIKSSSQTFDPYPLFNLVKNENKRIQNSAIESLKLMYERIPLKSEIDIKDGKFKNPLIDGICDPNLVLKNTCIEILINLKDKMPDIILTWILEEIYSPNYDKSIPLGNLLLKFNKDKIKKIPKAVILNLLNDTEWQLKIIGLKLISIFISENIELMSYLKIKQLITSPNFQIQFEILKLLQKTSPMISISFIINMLDHPNQKIRAQALNNLAHYKSEQIKPYVNRKIMGLLNDPSGVVRASLFNFFANMGEITSLNVPITPILDGLTDNNAQVRNNSVLVLERFCMEDPKSFDLSNIIDKIDPNNEEVLNNVLFLLGKVWERDPEKILLIMLTFIKFDNIQLKNNISSILISKYEEYPNLIIENLIKIPDDSKFISKGIISKTIIEIAKNNPNETITRLLEYLDSQNNDIILNALSSLQGLIDDYIDKINITPVLSLLKEDIDDRIKKEGSKFLIDFVKKKPIQIKPSLDAILDIIEDQDISVKISLSKVLLEIAKDSPRFIPIESIFSLLNDKEPFVRESAVKILGFIGFQFPDEISKILIKTALKDNEWVVRDAIVSSLGRLIPHVKNKDQIIDTLVSLLDDDESWVRRTAMNVLSNISELAASKIPFNKVVANLNSEDQKDREGSVGLLKIYSFNNIERIFDKIILLLGDESEGVRIKMVNTMVEIINKIGLTRVLSKLLKNMSDESSLEIQRSISLILKRTAKYEEEKIKKRVISVLKIRCEMSQDPVICEVFQDLKEV